LFLCTLAIVGLLYAGKHSSASIITSPTDTSTNSQRIVLLAPSYGPEIPQAIGGPDDIHVNNRYGLLLPQVSITSGDISAQDVEIDMDGIITYEVQPGDTLSEIAEDFDVSTNTIRWENNLGNTIKPGQELRILPLSGIRHTIKKGDTLGSIAKTYDVEIDDIAVFNDVDNNNLTIGEKILIPNGTKPVEKTVPKPRTSTSSASSKISSISSGSGYYMRPTTAPVTSKFGPRSGRYHYGIDYGAPTGTPIFAAAAGTVVKTSCGTGYGKCLLVQHDNGTRTLYAHASALYVGAGEYVSKGQTIAAIGSTGRSTGPHLHFEIIEANGKKRNVNFLQ